MPALGLLGGSSGNGGEDSVRALILTGGLGTRLMPLTKNTPKCMIKIAGKPVLEHLVEHLSKYGVTETIVNLHYKPEKIYKYFGSRLLYFYEPKLLGEEGTIQACRPWLGEHFIVQNGDTLTDINLREMWWTAPSVKAMEKDIYTGTQIIYWGIPPVAYRKKHYWQDMGTFEGLEKAKEHYEKTTHLS